MFMGAYIHVGHTCLHHAAMFGHVDIVDLLCQFSQRNETTLGWPSLINKRDPSGMTAFECLYW
jgi:ankyrin repeat protein